MHRAGTAWMKMPCPRNTSCYRARPARSTPITPPGKARWSAHSWLRWNAPPRLEGLDEDALVKYMLSATGQEIVKGALQTPDAREHVFCFFRQIVGLPKDDADRDFRDADADADRKQGQLKILLKQQLPGNVKEYTASWQGQGPSLDHLDALCDDVYADLSRVMLAEMISVGGSRCPGKRESPPTTGLAATAPGIF